TPGALALRTFWPAGSPLWRQRAFPALARDASTASGTGQPRRAVELAGRFSARCERTRAAVRVHIKCATMDLTSASFLPRNKDNGMNQMRGALRKPEQE